jgi:hypothetical protein
MNYVNFLDLEYSDGNTEAEAMWHSLGFKSILRIAIHKWHLSAPDGVSAFL